jgi:hypothetical protein
MQIHLNKQYEASGLKNYKIDSVIRGSESIHPLKFSSMDVIMSEHPTGKLPVRKQNSTNNLQQKPRKDSHNSGGSLMSTDFMSNS